MLGKLFKYDMKALSRILVPVLAGMVLACVLACAGGIVAQSVRVSYEYGSGYGAAAQHDPLADVKSLVRAAALVVSAFGQFAVGLGMPAAFLAVLHRFYKNLFTDEGYLTFTLPTSTGRVLLAKVLAGGVWMAVFLAATLLCSALALGAGSTTGGSLRGMVTTLAFVGGDNDLAFFVSDAWVPNVPAAVAGVLALFAAAFANLMLGYASLTLGAVAAQRHKVAAGVGFYVLFSWGAGMLTSLFVVVYAMSFVSLDDASPDLLMLVLRAGMWAVTLGIAALSWVVANSLLKRRLSLP